MPAVLFALAAAAAPFPDLDRCLKEITLRCAEANEAGASVVCFPEAALGGYQADAADRVALSADEAAALVRPQAERYGLELFCGFTESGGPGRPRMAYLHISPASQSHGVYRKTHLGRMERSRFEPGDDLPLFSVCGVRVGVQLCAESHFPELSAAMALSGAELILNPHASPVAPLRRRELWMRYLPARAYDNGVFFAAWNQAGGRFPGGVLALRPDGTPAAEDFSGRRGITLFSVDAEEARVLRRVKDGMGGRWFPAHRRPELYGLGTEGRRSP